MVFIKLWSGAWLPSLRQAQVAGDTEVTSNNRVHYLVAIHCGATLAQRKLFTTTVGCPAQLALLCPCPAAQASQFHLQQMNLH